MKRRQTVLDLDADKAFKDAGLDLNGSVEAAKAKGAKHPVFDKFMRHGERALTAEEWAAANIRNTMSVGAGSQGGYTVETDIVSSVTELLKQYGGMRNVAEVIQTAQGNPLNFPTSDGTSEVGEIVAENSPAASLDPSFGSVGLPVYKFSSKVITVPIELLQDSVIDVEQFITTRIASRLGRIQNQKFTVGAGSGSSEPNGVVTAASLGKAGTTGQTTTVIYDDLVDLLHSVDPAYRNLGRCRFMLNDASLAVISKLKDSSGRPVFLPGYLLNGATGKETDRLLGYPVQVNQDVATMAASAKSILFGDFSFYKIRDALAMTIYRFTDSAYTSKGQVGFLAWMRSGGNLVDAGGAVRYYQNAAS